MLQIPSLYFKDKADALDEAMQASAVAALRLLAAMQWRRNLDTLAPNNNTTNP